MRWFAAEERVAHDYSFALLPVPALMQRQLAAAFARRIAPGSGIGSLSAVRHQYVAVQRFCTFLAGLPDPPPDCSALAPSHIDAFLVYCRGDNGVVREWFRLIKAMLRVCDSLTPAVSVKVREPSPKNVPVSRKTSYSRAEFTRIAQAARSDLRRAATRIRANRALLARYRAGTVADTDRRCELLDFVDVHGDVPRYDGVTKWGQVVAKGWVTQGGFGSVPDIMSWLSLSAVELAAAAILLAVMTGQNPSVIKGTPAKHHRGDGYVDDGLATVIIDVHKPRRGRRAYMNAVLADVPDWISVPANPDRLTSRDQLHTPFGVYALLHELTMSARQRCGSDRLLVGYHGCGGTGIGRGFRPLGSREPLENWSNSRRVPSDAGDAPLRVTLDRLRLTFVELHQKPVAHTEETLVNEYLGRNRGNLVAYRDVVEAALQEEVTKARSRAVIDVLTKEELAQANPKELAAAHGLNADVFKRMLARELDTVMVACTDNVNSPFTGPDQPCSASFMMCLGCPCARALPHHLPVQVLVHDHLEARKSHMTPLVWVQRFGLPHAQLTDLLDRHDPIDIADARAGATPDQRRLVERFVNRELDIR
ncbi:hypothetical protein [Mycolicibacterium sp. NCC-Tsukiji]|uniref:hypothetical protein n=1 Tax=Mycolicibacterium sp. NCC-Tsukiji TaxID=2185272 RepID=UPI000ED031D6|nr:hypothetical protein [Mycolicibacterium sp. NCC-Tsukiji]GCB00034.1 hypothetical protein NCCNTM_36680 [Mycolicibacterium sp. NCC-Tsukiji]